MTKESCNRIGYRFQSGEHLFDHQAKVKLVGGRMFGDASIDLRPDMLIGVELWRVRRQAGQFETVLDGLVNAVAVHDQDGELLDRGLRDYAAHYRNSAYEVPSGTAVVVTAHASLVCKEHTNPIALGTRHQFGQNLCSPAGDEHRVLLSCSVQGALRVEAQGMHHLDDRGNAELNLELTLNELGDEAQYPQAEVERALVGAMLAHQKGQVLQLLIVDDWEGYAKSSGPPAHSSGPV